MKTPKNLLAGLFVAGMFATPSAHAILVDNGIAGDGFWEVDVENGGESREGNLDPAGTPDGEAGDVDIIFDYFHYVDVDADGGGVRLSNTNVTSPAGGTSGTGGVVNSAGWFTGNNGMINWTSSSTIGAGSSLYLTTLEFSSSNPFGVVRLIQYLDEDVLGVSDDHLIVVGTPGLDDFQLLTVDDDNNVGVSHAATYNTATGMTYIGWAADKFSDLRSDITGAGGATYSVPGVVDTTSLPDLGVGGDARYPGLQAYGPADITSAIAFDFDPEAFFASVIFSLGGSPSGTPPPPPTETDGRVSLPEPTTTALLTLGLVGLGWVRRRRRS